MIDWDSCVLWLDSKYFSETRWWDRSKYNNDGIVYGARFKENGFYFGGDDVVDCDDSESLRINDEISFEFLFYPYYKGYIVIKKNWDDWNKACGLFWGYMNSNTIRFYGNGATPVESSNIYQSNEKQHVVVTVKQSGKTKFYKDGKYLNEEITPTFSGDGDTLTIGARPNTGNSYSYFIKAKIYYIRIFHKILSEDEIEILARDSGV